MYLLRFWTWEHFSCVAVYGALRFHKKYLHLCSKDERRSYRFGTTWGWVINDRIFILGWTNPLRLVLWSRVTYFTLFLITVICMNILLLCFTHCSLSHDSNRNTTLEKVSKIWRKCNFQYACWGIRSEARNILGVVTYMPGPSRRSLPQYKVRCSPFRLMSPYQRGGAIHPKVTIWKKEGIEEHSHRVWWTALYTLTQVLQILHAHNKTKLFFFFCI